MIETDFEKKLYELAEELKDVNSSKYKELVKFIEEEQTSRKKPKENINSMSMHEALDYVRVCVKYLLFDVEAERRQNSYLKKLIKKIE